MGLLNDTPAQELLAERNRFDVRRRARHRSFQQTGGTPWVDIVNGVLGMIAEPIEAMKSDAMGQYYGEPSSGEVTKNLIANIGGTGLAAMSGLRMMPEGILGANVGGKIAPAKIGQGKSFLDDEVALGFDDAVRARRNYFDEQSRISREALEKTEDPSNKRVVGTKPSYGGTFGGDKVIPLERQRAYDAGLVTEAHPKAADFIQNTLPVEAFEGRRFVALPGDQTDVAQIKRVMGKDVDEENLGGSLNSLFGEGWQSGRVKMNPLAKVVEKFDDEEVLGSFLTMGGASSDFQPVTSRLLSAVADPEAISKEGAAVIDKLVRLNKNAKGELKFAGYPGVKSSEFAPWLLGLSNTKRSGFLKALTKFPAALKDEVPTGMAPYELIPGFDIPAVRHAITRPEMRNKILHPSDPSLGDVNFFQQGGKLRKSSEIGTPHDAFDLALPGGREGEFEKSFEYPMSLLFDDYIADRRAVGSTGNDFSPLFMNMLNVDEPVSVMTPEKVERFKRYEKIWNER